LAQNTKIHTSSCLSERFDGKRAENQIYHRSGISQYLSTDSGQIRSADTTPDAEIRPSPIDDEKFAMACIKRLNDKQTRSLQMLSEQFGPCDHYAAKRHATWLIRDTENVTLQARVQLPSIDGTLPTDAKLRAGQDTSAPFDPG
jgi:hypothetical protein